MPTSRERAQWDALVDELFDLDAEHPYLGQTVEPDDEEEPTTLGGPGSGHHGHAGRPGKIGGSAPEGSGIIGDSDWKDPGGFEHTGITWKQPVDKTGHPIPIKVGTVEEACQLIAEGKVVEVIDTKTAYTVIQELATRAAAMKAAGKEAKDYDLCQVSVAGTNLFCSQSVRDKDHPGGYTRILMPQIGGKPVPGSEADKLPRNPWNKAEVDGAQAFITHLQGIGVKTTVGGVDACCGSSW